ncbi:hypothetical protein DICVIV_01584 [Dictyocaulus viviparus]|uniref:Uncharacterized protein n=1 Tax=Dictyocaulus viviparus TaxID=29172 RepID=A0A0D8YCG2_DICVI|nr:hypothetical protein DICVIV_01584 [Dictyocaulus viviparus]
MWLFRCSNMWFSSFCVPDDSFGKPCSTILGGYFNKRFCCKWAHNTSEIYGNQCDRINLFGLKGKATCGYVAWFNNNDEIVDSWYKTK